MPKIVGERTYNFSARIIHIGMWIYQVIRFKKPEKTYNHWMVLDDNTGYIIEAIGKGTIKRKRDLSDEIVEYKFEGDLNYTNLQIGKKYEYSNFWWYFLDIIYLGWLGDKTDKKLNCTELVTRTLINSGYNIGVFFNPFRLKKWCDKNLILL